MRNYFSSQVFTTTLTTIVLLFVGVVIYGKLVGPINFSIDAGDPQRVFTVQGEGKVETTPNEFTSTFTINETGETQEEAQNLGDEKQNEAFAMLQELGFEEEDIQTQRYSINPVYNFDNGNRTTDGYEFVQSTTIDTTDREALQQALDRLAEIGINIGNISFEVNEEEYLQEAREKAIEDAREKAQNMADAGGFKVGKIVTISEQGSPGGPIPFLRESSEADMEMPQSSVISPGSSEVTLNVSVTYYIED